jgi:P27 family predicted phage terminase small subunit
LSKRAKRIWKQTVPIIPAGVLTLADGGTLAIYCQERARYEEAIEILYEEPPRFQPGSIEHRRLSITCDSAAAMMGRFGAKLGLSPSDRAGMSVPAAKPQNDKSRFFQAG